VEAEFCLTNSPKYTSSDSPGFQIFSENRQKQISETFLATVNNFNLQLTFIIFFKRSWPVKSESD